MIDDVKSNKAKKSSTTSKEDVLWRASFLIMADQDEKNRIWKDAVGKQYEEVAKRLTIYHTNQILYSADINYSDDVKNRLFSRIGETIGLGFYIYCADVVDVRHKFANTFEIRIPDAPGLQDYLVKEFEVIEDGGKVRDAIEPPKYVMETSKQWMLWTLKNVIPNDKVLEDLQTEHQKEFYMRKITWLIAVGYLQASLAERYHDIWLTDNKKVKG